ncbi:hypothetical protein KQX54_015508 [Cotesia glomerata]|uniref:Uncharacterized protein n=1 Tax=Cotesia glomerata TaxID=32391 RepID=A0AAV7IT93_COTGL|nr:hypothetical protein KQX54_015508 [Cotesia glomerata]
MSWCEEARKYHPAGEVVAEENPQKLKFRVQDYYSKVKDIYLYWIGCYYMCVKCWLLAVGGWWLCQDYREGVLLVFWSSNSNNYWTIMSTLIAVVRLSADRQTDRQTDGLLETWTGCFGSRQARDGIAEKLPKDKVLFAIKRELTLRRTKTTPSDETRRYDTPGWSQNYNNHISLAVPVPVPLKTELTQCRWNLMGTLYDVQSDGRKSPNQIVTQYYTMGGRYRQNDVPKNAFGITIIIPKRVHRVENRMRATNDHQTKPDA